MFLAASLVFWAALEPGTRALLEPAGITESNFEAWLEAHRQTVQRRLDEGAAEHIGYFLMQSRTLAAGAPLVPLVEARAFMRALEPDERKRFLDGQTVRGAYSPALRERIAAFHEGEMRGERHTLLRRMAERLLWNRDRIVQHALRFPLLRDRAAEPAEVEDLYQHRGLSGDPYPPSRKVIEAVIDEVPKRRVLLVGPGIELGSRFGLDDAAPVRSPQPASLRELANPEVFDCVDIREEVALSLRDGPCRAIVGDVVTTVSGRESYDLIVATNVLAYLTEVELAVAFSNFKQALAPGGCLLHNDARFAIRVAGEAAGLPVRTLRVVPLGTVNGREQIDRAVLHCRAK